MPSDSRTPSPWPAASGQLVLRAATPADLDRLLEFRGLPAVDRYLLHPHTDAETFREYWSMLPHTNGDFSCVADLAESPGHAVAIGYLQLVDEGAHPQTPSGVEASIGYIVDPAHAGRGVATDLLRGLLTAAFERVGVRRAKGACYAAHVASARVMARLGMRREEHTVADTWHAELGWTGTDGYAMLADEWFGRARGLPRLSDIPTPTTTPARPVPPPLRTESDDAAPGGVAHRTERLRLTRPTEADLAEIAPWRNRPEVGRWLLRPTAGPDDLRAHFLTASPRKFPHVARMDGRLVATGGFVLGLAPGQPGRPFARQAELGYMVDPDAAGRGIGRELAAALLDLAFATPGVRRVTAGLYPDNVASARLLAGLGLRLEQYGVLDSWHHDHGWVDGATYGVLAREWRGGAGEPAEVRPWRGP